MLDATDVWFSYDGGRQPARPAVLRGVTLHVARGAIVGILGPNGSGKTTMLGILAGVLAPDRGSVTLDGQPLARATRRALAQRIAVVPQETHLAFDYSVLEIVMMGRYPHLGAFELEGPRDLAIAREALAATGTLSLERRGFATLSGGEKQRVIIASALAQASDVLLLDEPTASLDLGYQLEVADLLRRLNRERGITMVLSAHDLNLAASLCGHVALLHAGQVLAAGRTADVLTPDAIARLYDVEAEVRYHEAAGHLTIVPIARRSARQRDDGRAGGAA